MSERWLEYRVVVTVGTGGVGKTTAAAAIALEAAARGRRTLVLTIDPARRLADALGLEELGQQPRRVPTDRLGGASSGELFAMMLDTQRTFDELVERFAPDQVTREKILANPIYRSLTDALAGTREYSAMEKLHQVHESGEYDLIVLDTPPASHALSFLDAPRRLTGFLDGSFLELLIRPAAAVGRTSFRLFRFGSEMALKTLQRVTGFSFLSNLSEFLLAFEGLLGGFRERARRVGVLLRDSSCGFVLVAGPDPEQVRRTVVFWERLRSDRIHLAGLIVNRVQTWPGGASPATSGAAQDAARAWLERHFDATTAERLVDAASRHAALACRDAQMSEQLEKALPLTASEMHRIPLLSEDIHTLEGLSRLRAHMFEEAKPHVVSSSSEA